MSFTGFAFASAVRPCCLAIETLHRCCVRISSSPRPTRRPGFGVRLPSPVLRSHQQFAGPGRKTISATRLGGVTREPVSQRIPSSLRPRSEAARSHDDSLCSVRASGPRLHVHRRTARESRPNSLPLPVLHRPQLPRHAPEHQPGPARLFLAQPLPLRKHLAQRLQVHHLALFDLLLGARERFGGEFVGGVTAGCEPERFAPASTFRPVAAVFFASSNHD